MQRERPAAILLAGQRQHGNALVIIGTFVLWSKASTDTDCVLGRKCRTSGEIQGEH